MTMHSGGLATHFAVFRVGSLVTANFKGKAPWPGMVDFCPDTDMWAWPKSEKMKYPDENYLGWFHVTFFGNPVTRAWFPTARVKLYDDNHGVKINKSATNKHGNTGKENNNEKTAMATRSKALEGMLAFSKSSKIKSKKMAVALELVSAAKKLTRNQRMAKFSFINNYKEARKGDQ